MAEVHLADDFYLSKERGDAKKILAELQCQKGGGRGVRRASSGPCVLAWQPSGELVGNVRLYALFLGF